MKNQYIFKKIFFLLLVIGLVSCGKDKDEEVEFVPAPQIDFEADETSTSSGLSVVYTNTSKNADPATYEWTIEYIGVNSPDEISPQLVFESKEENIQYTHTTIGYYRVTLFGSNSNGFGTSSILIRY
ncbi:hypothetical protein V9L05_06695 [Bernardetia sp. Wsw4-3y2]|uniref:hypothetical protein n=1 Tax=Bernardetia sp. Wsw4-3y2 TaxID=3127471 RepID=UPI0030CC02CE